MLALCGSKTGMAGDTVWPHEGQDYAYPGVAMLSVPTLWTVFVVNFFALGLIWAYVIHAYPKLVAARFWAGTALAAIVGAVLALLRNESSSLLPLLVAGGVMVFAACLAWMGTQRFYGRAASWRTSLALVAGTAGVLLVFIYGYDSRLMRVVVYSIGQSLPMLLMLKLLLAPEHGRASPGARLAAVLIILFVAVYLLRIVGSLLGVDFTVGVSSPAATATVLMVMFLSMSINFGLLLMAVERLRSEVADLALLDDLTGVANRRHLMQRLTEECARSERSGVPFSLLVIDLDGFKTINDTHGHAAGDACLQHFTLMAQTRLRPGDMLARSGGDEFCIVLPASTLREAAIIARRVLQVCREDAEASGGLDLPIAVSIGIAQWIEEIGLSPELLLLHADEALYVAKKEGKNRYAAYSSAPPVSPDADGEGTARAEFKRA
jgi:diguanylate cyclase (GGDEF)-like protein